MVKMELYWKYRKFKNSKIVSHKGNSVEIISNFELNFSNQVNLLSYENGNLNTNIKIIKYEDFCKNHNIITDYFDEIKLLNYDFERKLNTCNHKHYSKYYHDESIELIKYYFSKDIKMFNYKFETI